MAASTGDSTLALCSAVVTGVLPLTCGDTHGNLKEREVLKALSPSLQQMEGTLLLSLLVLKETSLPSPVTSLGKILVHLVLLKL